MAAPRTAAPLLRAGAFVVAVSCTVLTLGCQAGGDAGSVAPPPTPVEVRILGFPNDSTLRAGDAVQLTVLVTRAGVTVETGPVTWSSSDPSVATISAGGRLLGVAGGGSDITASATGGRAVVAVRVREEIAPPPPASDSTVERSAARGAVTISIPPGAIPAGTTALTVVPASPAVRDDRAVSGTVFEFGPAGTTFTRPITMRLAYDPAQVAPADRLQLRIFQLDAPGGVREVPESAPSATASVVTAPVSHFSVYGILRRAPTRTLRLFAGDGQQAVAGTAVAAPLVVQCLDSVGRAVSRVPVVFRVASGGGRLTGDSIALSDTAGVARSPSPWLLGPVAGANSLIAVAKDGGEPTATFAATGTVPPPPIIVLTPDTLLLSAEEGRSTPVDGTVQVTNGNAAGGALDGLTLDSIGYSGGRSGWLTATVASATAPTRIALRAVGGSLPVGVHGAVLTVRSARAGVAPAPLAVRLSVTAGSPLRLALAASAGDGSSGTRMTPAPVVQLRDAATGALVTGRDRLVTATLTSGSGTLLGGTTVGTVQGEARFPDLVIEGTGEHVLAFTAAGAPATSAAPLTLAPAMVLKAGALPVLSTPAGATFDVPLLVDLAHRAPGQELASLAVTVRWDPARLTYTGNASGDWSGDDGAPATVLVNADSAAQGIFRVSGFTTARTTRSVTLRRLSLRPLVGGEAIVSPLVTGAGGELGGNVVVLTRSLRVVVP